MRQIPCAIALAALAACAGPPPQPPAAPAPAAYTTGPFPGRIAAAGNFPGGEAQQLVPGRDVPEAWWTLFRSPALDALVRQALDASPTLARASARLRQAEEDRNARAGDQWPRVDAKVSANRIDIDPKSIGAPNLPLTTPVNLFLASVSVSYVFDLFGGTRHELEALSAEIDHQRYELEGLRLMLAGNVVTAAIREASLREQIGSVQAIVSLRERQLAITERLEQLGTAARTQVVARRLELAEARTTLPDLERQLEQVRHRLAVYTGQAPGDARLPEVRLADLQLPTELPLSVPSALARQRPDIRAADALLQQAGARVGVATAHLYPQLTLSANAGSLTTHAGDLFGSGTAFWLLGASLTQPLFRGGELQAQRRAAIAAYEQAGAAWQEVVLQGLQNVADVLRALEADGRTLQERAAAVAEARRQQEIADARYRAGGVSQDDVLEAERRFQSALLERTRAVADRHADSAALFQALGGGWWSAEPAAKAATP